MSTEGAQARVLVGSILGLALSPGTIVFYSLGVFMEPIMAAAGWSRGDVSFAASVFTTVLIFAIPGVGRLIDHFGVRRVLLPSIALFGLGLLLVGQVRTLWELYLAFAALAVLGAGANSPSYMRAVCTWFGRNRGLAIGVAQSGMGVGVMLVPALTQVLLAHGGWGFAYQGLGVMVWLIGLPIVAWCVHEAPQPAMTVEHGGTVVNTDVDAATAFRQGRYWVVVTGFFLLAGAINSTALHLVPLATAAGVARPAALLAVSGFGAAMLVGRLLTGVLLDRFFAPYVAAALAGTSTLAIAGLAWGLPAPWLIAAAFVIGLSAGSDGDLLSYVIWKYFGMRSFATLSSCAFSVYLLGTSVFPWVTGALAERYGYGAALALCVGLGGGGVLAMLVFGQSWRRGLQRVPQTATSEE